MIRKLVPLLFSLAFFTAQPLHALECASDAPISLASSKEIGAARGQTLAFKDLASELTRVKEASCKAGNANLPAKITPTNGSASLQLPDDEVCIRYKNGNITLTVRIEETCAASAAPTPVAAPRKEDAEVAPLVIVVSDSGAQPKSASVAAAQAVKVKNETKEAVLPFVCQDGAEQVASAVVAKGLTATLDLSRADRKKELKVNCTPGGVALTLAAVAPIKAEPPAEEKKPQCDSTSMLPKAVSSAALVLENSCGAIQADTVTLCFGPTGEFIGPKPALREGLKVTALVFAPESATGIFTVDVTFERTLIAHLIDFKKDINFSDDFVKRAETSGFVGSAGKLKVKLTRSLGTFQQTDGQNTVACNYEALTKEHVLEVGGHYHFSAGIMVTYTGLAERTYSRQTGDDGVTRIGEHPSSGIDYVANVTAYPFGVDKDHTPVAAGFLFGTSLASLGKRWYGGLELSSPIGFGISGGLAVVIVPTLDEPLVANQPFAGDQIATHNVAEPTYYLGVNLQAELFKKAFGALFSNSKGDSE